MWLANIITRSVRRRPIMEDEDVMLPPRMIHDRLRRRWRRSWRLFAVISTILLIDLFLFNIITQQRGRGVSLCDSSSSVSIGRLTSCPWTTLIDANSKGGLMVSELQCSKKFDTIFWDIRMSCKSSSCKSSCKLTTYGRQAICRPSLSPAGGSSPHPPSHIHQNSPKAQSTVHNYYHAAS